MRRNIIFLIWQDKPGGIEVLLPQISEDLPHFHFEAFVFRPKKKNSHSIFNKAKIPVTYGSDNNILLLFKLSRFLKKNKNHLFHGFNLGPFIFFVLKFLKIKRIIYSIHGTVYWKNAFKKLLFKALWSLSISKEDCFIANSNYSKSVFETKISTKPKIRVLYNPIDTRKFVFKEKKRLSKKAFRICYVGRLAKGKNLSLWIDVCEHILHYYPESEFALYGTGHLDNELREIISQKGLLKKVTLKGFISEVENAYYENDLMLFLSEYESFGNVVVESILCGTPVIASQIPSIKEIFDNYPQFLVPLDEFLKPNLIKKLDNYEELLKVTKKANIEFQKKFSKENHIQQLVKIYEKFYS